MGPVPLPMEVSPEAMGIPASSLARDPEEEPTLESREEDPWVSGAAKFWFPGRDPCEQAHNKLVIIRMGRKTVRFMPLAPISIGSYRHLRL